MMSRLELDTRATLLPKGTRVVLIHQAPARDGGVCPGGTIARVHEEAHPRYVITTPRGQTVDVTRAQLAVQHTTDEVALVRREDAWERYRDTIVLEVVVGSQAWGLANASSDEDVRGAFILPFGDHTSLFTPPDELAPPGGERQIWEVEKLIRQALRGDPNTLEMLWSPLVTRAEPIGARLRDERQIFVSKRVYGSFGRYAISQLEKLRRKADQHASEQAVLGLVAASPDVDEATVIRHLAPDGDLDAGRERLRQTVHSAFDRGWMEGRTFAALRQALGTHPPTLEAWRPKNAYNLLRLLHSAIRLLRTGTPMITVDDDALRARLLQIKAAAVPLDEVVAEAKAMAAEVDAALEASPLPDEPDFDAADALLRAAREHAARRHFHLPARPHIDATPLDRGERAGIQIPWALCRDQVQRLANGRDVLLCALVGAHDYGFPSPDSDLDLKGIFLASAGEILGLDDPPPSVDRIEVRDGYELDVTLNEARQAVRLLNRGNGNLLERLAAPLQIWPVPGASARDDQRLEELRHLARASVSRAAYSHYRGFYQQALGEIRKRPGVKRWLYAYRIAFTGSHLLRTGEVVADLSQLALGPEWAHVRDLIAIKRSGEEKAGIAEAFEAQVLADLPRLEADLAAAFDQSPLPAACPNTAALDAWLRGWRLG